MSFAALAPRRLSRSAGSLQLGLDLFAPVVPAARISGRPALSLVPSLPPVVAPLEVPVEMPAAVAPASLAALASGDGVFRVEVLVPGSAGWGFPVRESVVGPAPSARVARADAASADSRPVAVWALVGSDELLVWGAAA